MTPRTRQASILDLLHSEEHVSVDTLARRFGASHETIRRDLTALAEAGRIQKVHGGARLPRVHVEGPFQLRLKENADAKRAIARRAAALISPGDTLFIDTGSTTLTFAAALLDTQPLTVVTNSTSIARVIGDGHRSAEIYLLGGRYDRDNQETSGPLAITQIQSFRAHYAVITVGGVDANAGITDFNVEEAQVAAAMVAQSDKLVVLADFSKFNRIGSFAVCPLNRIDYLVSDLPPAGPLSRALREADVNLVC